MRYTNKKLPTILLTGIFALFPCAVFAQNVVTSTIIVKNTTSGSYAAAINTTPATGGCQATIGTGASSCTGLAASIPVNAQTSGTASFQATSVYNTLYEADVGYYLSTIDPGNNTQSGTDCHWKIQIIKQTSQYRQPWQGNVSYFGNQDTNTPLVPSCIYSNFTVDSSTGQFSIVLNFSGS